jgi:ankyrin repeat protein
MIRERTADVNKRDHVGRTPLHLAVIVKASDIACDLIDNGARITARLVDGRTALHLAARLDLPIVVKKLLERSAVNVEKEQEKSRKEKASEKVDKVETNIENNESNKDDEENGASDDDWTSVGTQSAEINSGPSEVAVIPEDDNETPDVLDVNLADWDLSWPPLFHAVASGSLSSIDLLITGGADVKVVTVFMEDRSTKTPLNVLPLALNIEDDDKACKVIERLIRAGAVSTTANDNLLTVFQRFVMSGRASLLSAVLRSDPNAQTAVNFPALTFLKTAIFPLVTAINKHSYSTIATLLAHGAKINYIEEDLFRARDIGLAFSELPNLLKLFISSSRFANSNPQRLANDHLKAVLMPVETAIANMNPIINLLVPLGGEVNLEARQRNGSESGVTYLDWIRAVIEDINLRLQRAEVSEEKRNEDFEFSSGSNEEWKRYYAKVESDIQRVEAEIPSCGTAEFVQKQREELLRDKKYFQDVESLLVSFGAKSKYDNTAGLIPPTQLKAFQFGGGTSGSPISPKTNSNYHFTRFALYGWQEQQVGEHAMASYDELFQACWDGDNFRIQQLCLPKIGSKLQVDPLQITVQMSTKYNHRSKFHS